MKPDGSFTSGEIAEKVIDLLNNEGLREDAAKMVFLSYLEGEQIIFCTMNKTNGQIMTYPFRWKEAAFNGYCLIQLAAILQSEKVIKDYLIELADRRGEIAEWIRHGKELFGGLTRKEVDIP